MESWQKGDVEHIGPFEHYDVTLDGRQVPFLTSAPMNGGMVHLTLDGRSSFDCSVAEAEQIVPFIADAIAIALGYTQFPRDDMESAFLRSDNPFPQMHGIIA